MIGCDDSHNTNTEEMENALSEMYWTIQSGSGSNDVIYDITIDKNDSIYLSGYTQGSLTGSSNIGNKDVILIKHNKNGKIDWSRQIGTVSNDEGKGIKYDSQNISKEKFFDFSIDKNALDVIEDGSYIISTCNPENFSKFRDDLELEFGEPKKSEIIWKAKNLSLIHI